MNGSAGGYCWNCAAAIAEAALPLSRHEYCRACGEALHCCRQCQWFAPGSAGACRETRAEPPTDKTVANFCDWFAFASGSAERERSAADAARARLEALFGGSETPE